MSPKSVTDELGPRIRKVTRHLLELIYCTVNYSHCSKSFLSFLA